MPGRPTDIPGQPTQEPTGKDTTGHDRPAAAEGDKMMGVDLKSEVAVLHKLHRVNQKEIALARLAKTNAQSTEVKDYADSLIKDHTAGDKKIMAHARTHGMLEKGELKVSTTDGDQMRQMMEMDQKMMKDRQEVMNRLRDLKGRAFDREFLTTMVSEHEKAVKLVGEASRQATDEQLKKLLTGMQPRLEEHRRMAKDLLDKLAKPADEPQGG